MDIHVLLEKGYVVWLDLAFDLIKFLELTSQMFSRKWLQRNSLQRGLEETPQEKDPVLPQSLIVIVFRSAEHQQRFETIRGWSFHRERRVQLREDEYTDF